jgi:hypothetical protein
VGIEKDQEKCRYTANEFSVRPNVQIHCTDFLEWQSHELFDVVVFPFNVFSEFVDPASRIQALEVASRLVGKTGDIVLLNSLQDFESWAEPQKEYSFEITTGHGQETDWRCDIRCVRDTAYQVSRCNVRYNSISSGEVVRDDYTTALLTRNEVITAAMAARLHVAEEWGSAPGVPLHSKSSMMVHLLRPGTGK